VAADQPAVFLFEIGGRRAVGTVGLSFKGTFSQKVDSKGRMSIPAEFRRVLADNDPDCPEKPNPRLVVLYGPHVLKEGCLHVYTVDEFAQIEAQVKKLPRGSSRRKAVSRMVLACAWETEIDRDGRIVLPKERREDIGLDGEATMVAMGDYFEVWNAETYSGQMEEDFGDIFEEFGEDIDPLSLLEEE
jgi:MraZ protein